MGRTRAASRVGSAPRAPVLAAATGSVLLAAGIGLLAGPTPASALEYTVIPETAADRRLVLSSVGPQFRVQLRPGQSAAWLIRAHLDGPDWASVELQLTGEGALVTDADGLRVTVQSCDSEWEAGPGDGPGGCPGTETLVVAPTRLHAAARESARERWQLGDLTATGSHHLRLVLSLPEGAGVADPEAAPRAATIGVGLFASGPVPAADPPAPGAAGPSGGSLASTGADLGGWVLVSAGALLAGGGLLRAHSRARQW